METRLGMITHCNSANFNDVDGIIGFGWANQNRSAAILKTLTQDARPHWDIKRKSANPFPSLSTSIAPLLSLPILLIANYSVLEACVAFRLPATPFKRR